MWEKIANSELSGLKGLITGTGGFEGSRRGAFVEAWARTTNVDGYPDTADGLSFGHERNTRFFLPRGYAIDRGTGYYDDGGDILVPWTKRERLSQNQVATTLTAKPSERKYG